jgi:SH3-like domain-containing protein
LTPSVAVKSSPSEKSTDLFLIHEGSKVEIVDSSMSEWIEVKFEEGKQGWIPVSAAEII